MIQSLEIANFRGFRQLALSNLPRFNILIGESGTGKTAFLEALWIQGGLSPEIYFRMRAFRGMAEQAMMVSDRRSYESFFSDIFYDPSIESGALIQIFDSGLGARSLNICYSGSSQATLNLQKPQPVTSGLHPLEFRWKVGETEYVCPLQIAPGGQIVVANPPEPFPAVFLASSLAISARETAERLSLQNVEGKKEKIVNTIKRIYSDIRDLTSESIAGQQMIWAYLKGLKQAIPLAVYSSGVNRLASVLLWISLNPGGVVLLDEAENGFYFLDYEKAFKAIVEFCDEYRVQLFASTHSKEYLKAIASALKDRETDLSMLKTKFHNGECGLRQIEGVSSIEAINQDIEIRLD
ncbi:MAG TPA: AAA family ATPase [Candidatus Acidoferrum sp.]|nr:AAA family ATPase [Candidatus Acidoferrum sp.]